MLLLLLFHLVVTVTCTLAGILAYTLVFRKQHTPLVFYPVMGLIGITSVTQVVALFRPVDALFSLVFTGLLVFSGLIKRRLVYQELERINNRIRNLTPTGLLILSSAWLLLLTLNAGPLMMDDTESYHIQMIKWLKEYGTVPGLANLHERYGFNSSWFSGIAFFLPSASNRNFYPLLNGALSLWLVSYIVFQWKGIKKDENNVQPTGNMAGLAGVFLLSLASWPLLRGNVSTTNYDFVTTLLVFLLFIETLKHSRHAEAFYCSTEWIIWPVYLFTVRTINGPLLLLSFFALWHLYKEKKWRDILTYAALACFCIVPYISRNVMLSGYAFYPAMHPDFFEVDWKVGRQTVDDLLRFIKYFNRVNTMHMDLQETEKLTFPGWLPVWFRYLFSYDKLVLIPGLLGVIFFFLQAKKNYAVHVRFFVAVLVVQLLSWLFIAPDPRFVYGPLLIGAFLLGSTVIKNRLYRFDSRIFRSAAVLLSASMVGFTAIKIYKGPETYRNFILPCQIPQPAISNTIVDGIVLYIPDKFGANWNARCYATALPCLYMVQPGLRARGNSIKDGFRIEKQ